jgi:DNA-binding NarL/FixJ family response regulator
MAHRCPRVLLADEHPVFLAGLRRLLEAELEVAAMVTDGQALLDAAERLRPDLVITDIAMPGLDGIEATRSLQASLHEVRVLILSNHAEPSYVRAAFEVGAWGYVTKSSAPEEIERAVREVLADRFYVSPTVAQAIIGPASPRERPPHAEVEALTRRELEIVRLVAAGLGNRQIAGRLGLAVTTVRTHLSSVYGKLQVKTRVELALYAAKAGDLGKAAPEHLAVV